MQQLNDHEYAAMLRLDFHAFVHRSFLALNPHTAFCDNWHLHLLAGHLERCRTGETTRLIINVPPRSMKSILASVAFPAFLLGHHPEKRIICASYGQDLADKLALDTRTVMEDAFYKEVFPNTRLSFRRQKNSDFMTTLQGGRMATSVGGVLTGRGADFLIIDDPLKPMEALSNVERQAVNDWYDATLLSRLDNKSTGVIIVIMQRLHMDDLVGHLLEQEGWNIVSLPAIATEDEVHPIVTPYGHYVHKRAAGHALHPERESLDKLAELRFQMGEYAFAGQYQQNPVPLGGGYVKSDWFKRYAPEDLPTLGYQILQSWDTANKASELSGFSVCTTWLIHEKNVYLLHVKRARLEYPALKRAVVELARDFRADTVLIEDKASGQQLIQELRHEGLHNVKGYKPEGDKEMRLRAQTAKIENGFVYLPLQAAWLADYLAELTSFPKSKFADQVDSTSQALAWMAQSLWISNAGLFDYYRELALSRA